MIRVTRKTLLTLSLGILTTAVLALGSVALIGSRVGSEIERYRGVLISRDDISVVQFDYDSHFWGGELRYRLVWRPERSAGTLARDTAAFVAAGYSVRSLIPYDFFPGTHHVECLALLERAGA